MKLMHNVIDKPSQLSFANGRVMKKETASPATKPAKAIPASNIVSPLIIRSALSYIFSNDLNIYPAAKKQINANIPANAQHEAKRNDSCIRIVDLSSTYFPDKKPVIAPVADKITLSIRFNGASVQQRTQRSISTSISV